jgi:hypothetical protein
MELPPQGKIYKNYTAILPETQEAVLGTVQKSHDRLVM